MLGLETYKSFTVQHITNESVEMYASMTPYTVTCFYYNDTKLEIGMYYV